MIIIYGQYDIIQYEPKNLKLPVEHLPLGSASECICLRLYICTIHICLHYLGHICLPTVMCVLSHACIPKVCKYAHVHIHFTPQSGTLR